MEKEAVELVKRAQKGDEEALIELFQISYRRIYATAFKLLKNDADTKDVIQDTYIELHKSIKSLRDPSVFYTWLNRVVTSKCYHLFNKKKKHLLLEKKDLEALMTQKETRTYLLPDDSYSERNDQEILYTLIQELKPKYAQVLEMMYLKQMKLQEIADVLDLPLGTIKSQTLRARFLLKKKIELFEKHEGRQLEFHLEPVSSIISLGLIHKLKNFIVGSSTTSTVVMSVTAGIVLCGAAVGIINETMPSKNQNMDQRVNEPMINVMEDQIPVTIGDFTYANQSISTSKEAYFVCLAFAYDKDVMKRRAKGQFKRIYPIYKALKDKNDQYWKALQERGWSKDFEDMVELYELR